MDKHIEKKSCSVISALQKIKEKSNREQTLLNLALRHKLVPYLPTLDAELVKYFTYEEIKVIRQLIAANNRRILGKASELIKLAKLFNENNIEFIVLKGIPLSIELYGNMSSRWSCDIDILIRKEDEKKVIELLEESYKIRIEWETKYFHHFSATNKKNNLNCEVHTKLFDYNCLAKEFEPFNHRSLVRLFNVDLPVLGYPYNFLYLTVHGIKHINSIYWLKDIWEFTKKKNFNLSDILILSKKHGILRMMVSYLLLVDNIFGLTEDMRINLKAAASKDSIIYTIVNLRLDAIYSEHRYLSENVEFISWREMYRRFWEQAILRPNLIYKYYVCEKHFASKRNVNMFQLPKNLYFLYIPLTPILWLIRKLKTR